MYNIDSLRFFTDFYGVRPSVCYPGYVVYTIYGYMQLQTHIYRYTYTHIHMHQLIIILQESYH